MKLGRYVVGLLSGLTFGILFAPKKGDKLRKELKKKGGISGQEALVTLVDAFKQAGAEAMEEAKKLSEHERVGETKKAMKEYLSQLEETGYDIAARAQEKLGELTEVATEASAQFKKSALKKKVTIKKATQRTAKKSVKRTAKSLKKAVKGS